MGILFFILKVLVYIFLLIRIWAELHAPWTTFTVAMIMVFVELGRINANLLFRYVRLNKKCIEELDKIILRSIEIFKKTA